VNYFDEHAKFTENSKNRKMSYDNQRELLFLLLFFSNPLCTEQRDADIDESESVGVDGRRRSAAEQLHAAAARYARHLGIRGVYTLSLTTFRFVSFSSRTST
jgi:hypothetical protein